MEEKDKKIVELETKLVKSEKERELDNSFWKQECDSLQKQLHDLPKKIVGEIMKELNNIVEVGDYFDIETDEEINLLKQTDIENILDTILKKYGGKK